MARLMVNTQSTNDRAASKCPPVVKARTRTMARQATRKVSPLLKSHEFSTAMKVRAYEIDLFGVVNNAVYVQYLQAGFCEFDPMCAARHDLLEGLGLENHPEIPIWALTALNLKYCQALKSQDHFLVTCEMTRATRASVKIAQRIIRLGTSPDLDQVALEATATVVLLTEAERIMRVPEFVLEAFEQYQSSDSDVA